MNTLDSSIGTQWPSRYDVFNVMVSNRARCTFDKWMKPGLEYIDNWPLGLLSMPVACYNKGP
jgi:hypothetical protein